MKPTTADPALISVVSDSIKTLNATGYVTVLIGVFVTGFVFFRGRRPERIFVVAHALCIYAKHMVLAFPAKDLTFTVSSILPLIDAGFLTSTVPIALLSNRYWPMWAASIIVMMFLLDFAAMIYNFGPSSSGLNGFVWVLILYTLVFVGTFLEGSRPSGLGKSGAIEPQN